VFAACRFPVEVITVAVRWYLPYGLSYRDVEELLAERGIDVDHVTIYRWVHRFAPLFADAARFARHSPGDRWFVDETYVKVGGVWLLPLPGRRSVRPGHRRAGVEASRRPGGPPVLHPGVDHADTDRGRNRRRTRLPTGARRARSGGVAPRGAVREQPIEADHSRLKQRLRPMRGLRTDRTAQVVIAGIAFMQNLRRGHYELATETVRQLRVAAAFTELARAI
jgi:transposase-like protein